MFNAGAAGAATVEPVLKTVRFVSCVSAEERANVVIEVSVAAEDIYLQGQIRLITCLLP